MTNSGHNFADLPAAQAEFSAKLEQHRGIVSKIVFTYCSNPEDRKELAQEIAAQLWRSYRTYDSDRAFSTWMYRVALNVAILWVRRHARRIRHVVEVGGAVDDIAAPERAQDSRAQVLRSVIATLDPMNRALLALYLEARSYREISEILGISETNVATKISRLKRRVVKQTQDLERE
ncbi:MAG: sigma-70 family RNA polymerase sigma factor [Pseudomonadota bacterium]